MNERSYHAQDQIEPQQANYIKTEFVKSEQTKREIVGVDCATTQENNELSKIDSKIKKEYDSIPSVDTAPSSFNLSLNSSSDPRSNSAFNNFSSDSFTLIQSNFQKNLTENYYNNPQYVQHIHQQSASFYSETSLPYEQQDTNYTISEKNYNLTENDNNNNFYMNSFPYNYNWSQYHQQQNNNNNNNIDYHQNNYYNNNNKIPIISISNHNQYDNTEWNQSNHYYDYSVINSNNYYGYANYLTLANSYQNYSNNSNNQQSLFNCMSPNQIDRSIPSSSNSSSASSSFCFYDFNSTNNNSNSTQETTISNIEVNANLVQSKSNNSEENNLKNDVNESKNNNQEKSTTPIGENLKQAKVTINFAHVDFKYPSNPVRNKNIRVKLEDVDLWNQFSKIGTEMLLTKHGRRMFPFVRYRVSGLERKNNYIMFIDFIMCDKNRYKYVNNEWVVASQNELDDIMEERCFIHPDSPMTGESWMKHIISFNKVKLTNNKDDISGHIILNSMHKYIPRLHIVEEGCSMNTFLFDETSFIAVTSYQNSLITKLKIDNNPFARGFRDGQKRKDRKESSTNVNDNHSPKNENIHSNSMITSYLQFPS